ncbi:MAG: hypothetical protein ACXU82_13230 [Caulobacteraceae bacterium]
MSPLATNFDIVDASSDASGTPGANNQGYSGEVSYYSFSPDGSKIAFALLASGLVSGVNTGAQASQVYVKELSTGAINLASSDASGTAQSYPGFLGSSICRRRKWRLL